MCPARQRLRAQRGFATRSEPGARGAKGRAAPDAPRPNRNGGLSAPRACDATGDFDSVLRSEHLLIGSEFLAVPITLPRPPQRERRAAPSDHLVVTPDNVRPVMRRSSHPSRSEAMKV